MAHCLSCFAPSPSLGKYLLKFIGDHSQTGQKSLLQRKLVRAMHKAPRARSLPPSLLEWRSARHHADMALPLILPDGQQMTVAVDSWSTCEELAASAIASLGMNSDGWSCVLDDSGSLLDTNGYDYVFDLISELELCPAFPAERSDLLKVGKKVHNEQQIEKTLTRPQNPPPEPPVSRKTSRETSIVENVQRKSSQEILSRNSALNDRYFEQERTRSRSLDNLLDSTSSPMLSGLGLSQSKLNDRYRSSEKLNPIEPVLANVQYMSKQELDFEYPDVSSIGAASSHKGSSAPRFIKSQYAGKKAPPGSHSSRAHIEKSEPGGPRSSAMSDTSEAPSLASHVRRVRVPSQASDVDQFLDELFSPVLDGNLDELSDARSLAASIRGGGQHLTTNKSASNVAEFLDELFSPLDGTLDDLSDATALATSIRGGGQRPPTNNQSPSSRANSVLDEEVADLTSRPLDDNIAMDDYISDLFRPIFVNDSLKKLTEKDIVENIKGGGTKPQENGTSTSTSNFPYSPMASSILTPPPLLMPFLGGQSPDNSTFVPLLNMPTTPAQAQDYQQNLQRAFLQTAMAQNLQMQQQLLAQNQAFRQLLIQQMPDLELPELQFTTIPPAASTPNRRISNSRNGPTPPIDLKSRKASSESQRGGMIIPPPPPPMPPPVDESDPSESRPFLDPYGRAKTVRIGKWRWPPPQDGSSTEIGDFMQFKIRQQRKMTPSKEQHGPRIHSPETQNHHHSNGHHNANDDSSSMDWDELDMSQMSSEQRSSMLGGKFISHEH